MIAAKPAVVAPGALARVRAHYRDLNQAEQKVAEYVLADPGSTQQFAVTRLAERTGTSVGTVVRFCQKVGFAGYAAFRTSLAVELLTPGYLPDEQIGTEDDAWSALSKTLQGGMNALSDTLKLLDRESVQRAAAALAAARRLDLYGNGAISVPLSLYAQHRFLLLGIPCAAYAHGEAQAHAALLLGPGDVAVGISHYGAPSDVVQALALAREAGATTIAITHAPHSNLAAAAEIVLLTASHENVPLSDAVSSRIPLVAVIDGLYAAAAVLREQAADRPDSGAPLPPPPASPGV